MTDPSSPSVPTARSFAQLAGELDMRYPLQQDIWTFHQMASVDEAKCPHDWGMSLVYHFNRGVALPPWLEIYTRLVSIVHAHSYLKEVVEFVPFYEIGADFLVQCKPPYDGGYSTAMYEEHLQVGNLTPPPGYASRLGALRSHVAAMLQVPCSGGNDHILLRTLSALFISPNSTLYWSDVNRWAAYLPPISPEDVAGWDSAAASHRS